MMVHLRETPVSTDPGVFAVNVLSCCRDQAEIFDS